jgi:hypothetical protein
VWHWTLKLTDSKTDCQLPTDELQTKKPFANRSAKGFQQKNSLWCRLLSLADSLGGQYLLVVVNDLNQVHAHREVAYIVMLVLFNVLKSLQLPAHEVENGDVAHVLILVDADEVCGRVRVNRNLDRSIDASISIALPEKGKGGESKKGYEYELFHAMFWTIWK